MPDVLQVLRMRQAHRERALRNPRGRLGLGCAAFLSLVAALSALALSLAYSNVVRDLPPADTLSIMLDPPGGLLLQPTRFYDRSGEHILLSLEAPAAANKEYLSYDLIPTSLISATLVTAEPGFWGGGGYTLTGIVLGSQPTLAQRLVSDLVFRDDPPGLWRTVRERVYAAQITARYGREQVLTWYLNSANYGRLAFGADAAARVYFGKPARQLTLAESALLAAVAQAPALNPLDASQAAFANEGKVIQEMLERGWITPDQAEAAKQQEIDFHREAEPPELVAPDFLSLAVEELYQIAGVKAVERGGLRVITTLDYDLQTQVVCTAQAQLERMAGIPAEITSASCPAAELLPAMQPAQVGPGLAAGAVIFDPVGGELLALADSVPGPAKGGGRDPSLGLGSLLQQSSFQVHSPGSLWTPFIYLTAFTHGWSPASLVWDIPVETRSVDRWKDELSLPMEDHPSQGPMRLRLALANDYLAPAMQVLDQVGSENIRRTLHEFGLLSGELSSNLTESPAADGRKITLLQAAQAYGIFANQGIQVGRAQAGDLEAGPEPRVLKPITILKIEDSKGRTWGEAANVERRPVTNPQLAYLITEVLSDETARWRSLGQPNFLELGRPAAIKLGSTSTGLDTWAVGYTPQFVVGVWMGYPETGPQEGTSRITPNDAAVLWQALAKSAAQGVPPQGWPPPPEIVTLEVCDPSGLLPSPDCPAIVREVFLAGSEPQQADTLFRRVQINRETGRLATIFTPAAQIEERVYLIPPPEAAQWAMETGLPVPPDTYDVIRGQLSTSPEALISSPEIFSSVSGKVALRGRASGEGFESYRLQAGAGLNPREWIQIGEDSNKPVEDGQLGIWDTQGLSGLYALQLLVLREGQRVDTAVIQLTVDNEPPVINSVYPVEGQMIEVAQQNMITFRASIQDDFGLESVEFYLDGRSIHKLSSPPFVAFWQIQTGSHTLQVVAKDRAGNTSKGTARFEVKK